MTMKPYSFLSKKKTELALVFTGNGFFCVLVSNRIRKKMLSDKKVFIGKVQVLSRDWDIDYKIELVREWWESVDDGLLIERLSNAPKDNMPLLNFDSKLWIMFSKVKPDELVSWMFLNAEEIPPEQDD